MDFQQVLDEEWNESGTLEYKSNDAHPKSIVRELVAFANAGGGSVLYGIQEDNGEIIEIQDIADYASLEERIHDIVRSSVEPSIDFEMNQVTYNEKTILAFTVSEQRVLTTFENNKAQIPIRQGSTTDYMHGYEIHDYYQRMLSGQAPVTAEVPEQRSDDEADTEGLRKVAGIGDEPDRPVFFIPTPDGSISGVCTFADVFLPRNPVRITARSGGIPFVQAEHMLASLQDAFELSNTDGQFTINQKNAAWVGDGFTNFVETLKRREPRYKEAPADYDLDLYKSEQGVFVCNLGLHYPESLLVVHVEPYRNPDLCRRFTVNFLLNGHPADARPLTEFADAADLSLTNAHTIETVTDSIANPRMIPVDPAQTIKEHPHHTRDTDSLLSGLLTENPFFGRDEVSQKRFDLEQSSPISDYQYLHGHFVQYPGEEDLPSVESQRLSVFDLSAMTESIPLTLHNILYQLDW